MNKSLKTNFMSFETRVPPLLTLLIHMVVAFVLAQLPGPKIPDFLGSSAAYILALLSFVLIVPSVVKFLRSKTTMNPLKPQQASVLVQTGLYRFSRNPMYLGMLFLLAASILYFHSFLSILAIPCFVVVMNKIQIEQEEKALCELFGTDYRKYCDNVRRWL